MGKDTEAPNSNVEAVNNSIAPATLETPDHDKGADKDDVFTDSRAFVDGSAAQGEKDVPKDGQFIKEPGPIKSVPSSGNK